MYLCGRLSIPDAVHSIALGDLLFSFSSIVVHVLETFDSETAKNATTSIPAKDEDRSSQSVLDIQNDANYTKAEIKILCWIYLGISLTNILLAILLWQAVLKSCVLKCMSYLVISPFVITIGLSTLLFHAVFLGPHPHYFALGMYPGYWAFKLYSLWAVHKFLQALRESSKKQRRKRRQGYESIEDDGGGSGSISTNGSFGTETSTIDSRINLARHGEADQKLEFSLPTKLEIAEERLELDHRTCLEFDDLVAVIRGVLATSAKKPSLGECWGSKDFSESYVEVAAKTLKVTTPTIPFGQRLLQEAKLMVHIGPHDHVLKFYGVCTQLLPKEKIFLVTEYYPRGKLDAFLRDCADTYGGKTFQNLLNSQEQIEVPSVKRLYENLPISKVEFTTINMVEWAYQIANAMEYLHIKRVIYGNLQAKSVVLIHTNLVKLTGFAFPAKLYSANRIIQREDLPDRFPWRWTAIECVQSTNKLRFTTRTDVWSYGVTLWEIFSLGEVPYGLWESDIVRNLISGQRLEKPKYAPNQIFQIMEACWRRDPGDRPNFNLLKLFFQQLLSTLTNSRTSY